MGISVAFKKSRWFSYLVPKGPTLFVFLSSTDFHDILGEVLPILNKMTIGNLLPIPTAPHPVVLESRAKILIFNTKVRFDIEF